LNRINNLNKIMVPPIPNPREGAQRIFAVLKNGGIALCPTDLGYALMAANPAGLEKIFMTKQRAAQKRHPMVGSYALHKELHILSPERAGMVRLLTQDLKIPLAVVAKYDPEHRVIKKLSEDGLEASTADGTIVLMMGTGSVSEEVTRLCEAEGLVMQGSSANPSGTGEWLFLFSVTEED
jgi:tRNA A37 threonylcarbamoyladenosine synthetase subunit TsaC/SUA5/YrdC